MRTVKDKKGKGKNDWMKTLIEEQNELLRTGIKASGPYSTSTPLRRVKKESDEDSDDNEEKEKDNENGERESETPVKNSLKQEKVLLRNHERVLKSPEKQ